MKMLIITLGGENMQMRTALPSLCLFLVLPLVGCVGASRPHDMPDAPPWSAWSNGLRMRMTPTKPVFTHVETPTFSVQFQARKPVDVNIPYLLPSSTNSVIGPFTMLEVWVTDSGTGARYQDQLGRVSKGRHYALVPKGSSLQRLTPKKNVATTFSLKGPFMSEEGIEKLREAREMRASVALPKSLQRLPPGTYTMSLKISPCSLEGRPDYYRAAMENPPKRYRNVWTGVLGSGEVRFKISPSAEITEQFTPPDPASSPGDYAVTGEL